MKAPYRLLSKLFYTLPLPEGKLAESRAGRLGATARWIEWAESSRTQSPLVWFHAASVGESQVVAPIAARLRARHHGLQTVLTYSSPSMARWPVPLAVDRGDYAPADLPQPVAALFNALRPAIIAVSRGDLWPEMVRGAWSRHVPVAVVGGAVRPSSHRLRWPTRPLLRSTHRRLAFVGAVSRDDAARWIRLGVPPNAVRVTGDPRDDFILERPFRPGRFGPIAHWAKDAPDHILVAGSTHAEDEGPLLAALTRVRSHTPSARLIVVPHEPGPEIPPRVASVARQLSLETAVWNGCRPPDASILVVNERGCLNDLYALATLAYVGGGFGRTGVHSLAEPASHGLPILAGPGALRDPAARAFVEAGGAAAAQGSDAADALGNCWIRWLRDARARHAAGLAARGQLARGAADKSVTALEELLGPVVLS
jgi:3-deoxy-D-manno-octulosonic-acid transferase